MSEEGSQQTININEYDRNDFEDVVKSLGGDTNRNQKELRIFTHKMKEECWKNAQILYGRHPERWRIDSVGNPVVKGLKACMGPLCHEYDHIIPFSKGGKTTIENCQILQTAVNRAKGNRTDMTQKDLRKTSHIQKFTVQEMDIIEKGVYGNIKREDGKIIKPQTIEPLNAK